MKAFTKVESKLVTIPVDDIDTDQIIPARFLKITDKIGLGDKLFSNWRYSKDGGVNPDFALNRPGMVGREILLAGDNFGCGSSREHAAWALSSWGFRVVISTSFADIFRNNSLKNGLLLVQVGEAAHKRLLSEAAADNELAVDLGTQELQLADGGALPFPIDAFSKRCLTEGLDQLGYLLRHAPAIGDYERNSEQESER